MKKYQVFVRLTGEIRLEAENENQAEDIVNDGFIVLQAVKDGLFDIEIEDVNEYEED